MKDFIRRNGALVVAFVLPVVFIVGVTLSVYIPSLLVSTNYNFVYATCEDGRNYYRCGDYLKHLYGVEDGKIIVRTIDPLQDSDNDGITDVNENYVTRLFLHDTNKNVGREITPEEAKSLQVSGLLTSPDGVSVSGQYDRGGDYFLFFGTGSTHGYYLTEGRARQRLNLIDADERYYYYADNFQFIGWVLPGRE